MDFFDLLNLIGGLALFLYGMTAMGNSLSKMAGGKLESVLERLTSKKIFAVLLGLGVTAVIQSSSATTVMVVGFVNSGIMKLSQSVGIIMGANIGTTVTSWILSLTGIQGDSFWVSLLKPTSFSPVFAAIGIIMLMFSNPESKKRDIGSIMLGFAILMFGMETMSSSVAGLADDESFTGFMTAFSNPILGMLAGTILTAIIQSSSASVGILQALCLTGVVDYSMAIPIIMGQNIGTCVTSIISAIGASKNAKRAAMVHLYFNLIGTILFMCIFYSINAFVHFGFLSAEATPVGIAVIHSSFNIAATIVLYPFSNLLVRLAEITIPDSKAEKEAKTSAASDGTGTGLITIDERFLGNPSFAMELCRGKAKEMANVTRNAIMLSLDVLAHYDKEKAAEVIRLESVTDRYEDVLGSYLIKLSGKDLSVNDSQGMSMILHSISDFERITDHAMDIVKSAEEINNKRLSFSPHAKDEIKVISGAIADICNLAIDAFCDENEATAKHVEPLEEVIDTLTKRIKENHIKRLQKGTCSIEMGFILQDILTGLERVSDHCSNVAVEMLTIYDNGYNTHEYFKNFTDEQRIEFDEEYDSLIQKYPIEKQ